MNVLFLNPPFHSRFSRESRSPAVAKSGTLYYPKWLAYAAGAAIQSGHEVDLVDAPASGDDLRSVSDRIEAKGIQAIVCDTSTPSIVNDVHVVEHIKQRFPKLPIILVGRHVSAMPDQTLRMSKALHYGALREYEHTVTEWLEAVASGADMHGVKGLAWKDNDEVVINEPRPPLENLDKLPFVTEVYKRFLNIRDYFYGHSLYPLVVFDTSRGCPYRCSFCAYPQTFSGHRLRFRSVENVADEFDYVAREFSEVKSVMLEDDTFVVDKKRTLKLAEELIRRDNRLAIDANCRADTDADIDFFKTLRKAGVRLFCVGFESGDDQVLSFMKKRLNLTMAEDFMRRVRAAGIMVHGCFMVGNLNETRRTLQQTLDLALKLNPDTAQFYPIMVYPGTLAYEQAKELGYLSTEDYTQWLTEDGLHNSVIDLPDVTHQELVEFCDHARRAFYLRPRYIWHKALQSLKNPAEFTRNLKGFGKLVGYLAKGSFMGRKKNRQT